jgi:hypothetical protein
MKCDSRASLLACTFVSPCLGYKPKARVATHGKVDLKLIPRWHAFEDISILLGCFGDVPQTTWVMGIPIVMMMSKRAMVPWTSI